MRRIAIVGAGVLGLVAGRELARQGFGVDLYERWPDVGGQASAFDLGNGVWLERYYHHLFQSDREMIALHAALLPGELEWHRSTVGMYAQGRVWPFLTPQDLLAYGPLGRLDRVRLGLATLRLVRRTDWERMDEVSALEWLRRTCGDAAVEAVWRPLMLGKFGEHAAGIPLAWLWSKLVLRRQKLAGTGATKELLGYPKGSFMRICVALAGEIRERGGSIHLDREVVAVERDPAGFALRCAAPGAYRGAAPAHAPARDGRADAVLLTTPSHIARRLVAWPDDLAERLGAWQYRSAVVLLLELTERFSDTYWINIADPTVPFLGLIEHTNLVPSERYPARYLYVSNYVAQDDPLTRLDTDGLLGRYRDALRRIQPRFDDRWVTRAWSFREDAAQPIPSVGGRARLVRFDTPVVGLFLANTTQIYPEDRGTEHSARLGRVVAAHVGAALA